MTKNQWLLRTLTVAAAMLMTTSCGVPKKEFTDLRTQFLELQATEARLRAQRDAAELEVRRLENQLAATSEKANEVEEQLQEKTNTYKSLVSSLESEIQEGKITISEMKDKLTVNLIDKILFDSGKTTIKPEGENALSKVANVLKSVDDKRIQVNGHTDNVPIGGALKQKYPSNWELSAARATSVVRYLAEYNVPETKLSAAGFADTRPVSDNSIEEGRRQNRRIEIVLVPDVVAGTTQE